MTPDPRLIVFGLVTLILAFISRASLARPRSHGFYRFFAWEAILCLILLNVPYWFQEWFAWHQVLSWILLCASIIPLTLGVNALRTRGKPDQTQRSSPELLSFERTSRLVSDGVYHYIRHPLYSSLFLLSWGLFFKAPSGLGSLLAITATLFLVLTAKRDEAECLQTFGEDYRVYMRRTTMFIPYLF